MAPSPVFPSAVPQDPDDVPTAWVVQERTGEGKAPLGFWVGVSVLATLAAILLMALAVRQGPPLDVESTPDGTLYRGIATVMGVSAARMFSTIAAALAVFATAVAVRALTHSPLAGLVAAGLLLLDPAFLLGGHLALPDPILLACAMGTLALAVLPRPNAAWGIVPVMTVGALVDARLLLWGVPLVAVLFLRGHIYAAPKHLATAATQTLVIPAALALPLHLVLRWAGPATPLCPTPTRSGALLMDPVVDLGGLALVHNPAVWYGGALALAGLALGALLYLLGRFRLARMPGRVQIRLPDRLPRLHGRTLWLTLLAAAAPLPVLWLPLFAAAIALGARQLGRDAPWFGILVHAAAFAFATIYLVRLVPVILGADDPAGVVQQVLPWVTMGGCPS